MTEGDGSSDRAAGRKLTRASSSARVVQKHKVSAGPSASTLAEVRDLIKRGAYTPRERRSASIGRIWMPTGVFTEGGAAFIGCGDDKKVTLFDMRSESPPEVLVRRPDGINCIALASNPPRLCVADEGGSLQMYDLDALIKNARAERAERNANIGKKKPKRSEIDHTRHVKQKAARMWQQYVAKGFGWGRGHSRRQHGCRCDGCSNEQARLSGELHHIGQLYEVKDIEMDEITRPKDEYEASLDHHCTCAACSAVMAKVEGRLERIKEISDLPVESFPRIATTPDAYKADREWAKKPDKMHHSQSVSLKNFTKLTKFAALGVKEHVDLHQCGCLACGEALCPLPSPSTL